MVRTKSSSVKIDNLHPLLLQFLQYMSDRFDGIVVTSGNDSIHSVGSRHYIDKAIDIGANSSQAAAYSNFKEYVLGNVDSLKSKYQIEDIIDEGDHIHIELPLTVQEAIVVRNKQYLLVIGVVAILLFGYFEFLKGKKII